MIDVASFQIGVTCGACAAHRVTEAKQAEIDALKAQRDALLAAREWRPIESAPKDERIIVRCKNETHVAHWSERRGCWMCSPDWSVEPTHWQPLPAAPKGGAA